MAKSPPPWEPWELQGLVPLATGWLWVQDCLGLWLDGELIGGRGYGGSSSPELPLGHDSVVARLRSEQEAALRLSGACLLRRRPGRNGG